MSSTVSMFFRTDMLERIFYGSAGFGSTFYVALTKTVPEANAPGANLDEVVGFGYARQAYPVVGENWWSIDDYGVMTSLVEVDFPAPTASWGLLQGWALTTSLTEGETCAVGSLVNPSRIDFGDSASVDVGGISFALLD